MCPAAGEVVAAGFGSECLRWLLKVLPILKEKGERTGKKEVAEVNASLKGDDTGATMKGEAKPKKHQRSKRQFRSHEVKDEEFETMHNNQLITVFSATNMSVEGEPASALWIEHVRWNGWLTGILSFYPFLSIASSDRHKGAYIISMVQI
jgi:hypothetical protein